MEVIPLTLALSLLLSLTFIALFVREFTRPRRAGAEHESLLPLEAELSVTGVGRAGRSADSARAATVSPAEIRHEAADLRQGGAHEHFGDEVCASRRTDGRCCSSCQRRKDRAAAREAGRAASAVQG